MEDKTIVIRVFAPERKLLDLAVELVTCSFDTANSMCELSHSVLAEKSLQANPEIAIVNHRRIYDSLNKKEQECFCKLLCAEISGRDGCVGEIDGFDYDYDEYDILLTYDIDACQLAEKARKMAAEGGVEDV